MTQANFDKNVFQNDENSDPNKYQFVCSLHFKENDFIQQSPDQKRRLKAGVIPTVFKNYNLPVFEQTPLSRKRKFNSNTIESPSKICRIANIDHPYCLKISKEERINALKLEVKKIKTKCGEKIKKSSQCQLCFSN